MFVHLSDLMMSNPLQLEHHAFVAWMRQLAHQLPLLIHTVPMVGLDEKFVLARMEQVHFFSELVLRRVCFIQSLRK